MNRLLGEPPEEIAGCVASSHPYARAFAPFSPNTPSL
jgi:hypothetical protein